MRTIRLSEEASRMSDSNLLHMQAVRFWLRENVAITRHLKRRVARGVAGSYRITLRRVPKEDRKRKPVIVPRIESSLEY
jgi:hypothetical protein